MNIKYQNGGSSCSEQHSGETRPDGEREQQPYHHVLFDLLPCYDQGIQVYNGHDANGRQYSVEPKLESVDDAQSTAILQGVL